jgi:uncharacterized coiled-coil DUF342 family protein
MFLAVKHNRSHHTATDAMKKLRELLSAIPTNEALRGRIALIHEEAEKLHRENEEIRQENEKLKAQVAALERAHSASRSRSEVSSSSNGNRP